MPLALNGNPSHGSPPFSQLGNSLEVLRPVLCAKFVIFARIVVALVGDGIQSSITKMSVFGPFFLAEGREGRIKRPGVFPFIGIFWLRESPTTSPLPMSFPNKSSKSSKPPPGRFREIAGGWTPLRVRVEIIKERYSFGLTPIPSPGWRSPPGGKRGVGAPAGTLAGAVACIAF